MFLGICSYVYIKVEKIFLLYLLTPKFPFGGKVIWLKKNILITPWGVRLDPEFQNTGSGVSEYWKMSKFPRTRKLLCKLEKNLQHVGEVGAKSKGKDREEAEGTLGTVECDCPHPFPQLSFHYIC